LEVDTLVDSSADPETAYDRAFAHAVVERALACLRIDHEHDAVLLPYVLERGDKGDLKGLAAKLGITQNSLSQRLRRLRLRLRELLREEFANLVADPAQIDDELMVMRRALTS